MSTGPQWDSSEEDDEQIRLFKGISGYWLNNNDPKREENHQPTKETKEKTDLPKNEKTGYHSELPNIKNGDISRNNQRVGLIRGSGKNDPSVETNGQVMSHGEESQRGEGERRGKNGHGQVMSHGEEKQRGEGVMRGGKNDHGEEDEEMNENVYGYDDIWESDDMNQLNGKRSNSNMKEERESFKNEENDENENGRSKPMNDQYNQKNRNKNTYVEDKIPNQVKNYTRNPAKPFAMKKKKKPQKEVCKFYSTGQCKFGSKCNLLHTKEHENPICKYYLSGSCKFEDDCIFRHEKHYY